MANTGRAARTEEKAEAEHIEAAAGWMARLLADDATEQDRIQCERWRRQDARHEQAWQRLCEVSGKLASLPADAGGSEVLERAWRAASSRRRFLSLSALAGIAITSGWLGGTQTRLGRSLLAQYRTGVGETETVTLADGTRLTLNTDSAVDASLSSQERRIRLHQGELLIETGAETPRRRFAVDTFFGQVIALGTEFNVRQRADRVQVAVLDGAVEIRPASGGTRRRVVAGQQARFDTARAERPEALQADVVSWRQGKLVAEGMRVADFVEEIARYRRGFTLHDDAVADLTVSGVFSLEDTDRALRGLAASLPVALRYRTDYWVKVVPAR